MKEKNYGVIEQIATSEIGKYLATVKVSESSTTWAEIKARGFIASIR